VRIVPPLLLALLCSSVGFAQSTARLVNLSVRTNAGAGADALIVGFSLAGTGTKPVLIRGVGPGLAGFGVTGVVADPNLRLDVLNGPSVAQNDNWEPGVATVAAGVGAFALPPGSRDAALQQTLATGTYTVQLGGGNGVALVELYDTAATGAARFANVSARTRTGAGGDTLIAGFGIGGTGMKTLLVRAVGPGLAAFGVEGTLTDPQLAIFAGSTRLASNDDWGNSTLLSTASTQVGAFALPAGSRDAALLVTLPPGSYTAQVTGANNSSGVVLVEVYEAAEGTPPQPIPTLEILATEGVFPSRLFRVDAATGAATPLGSTSFLPGLAFRRDGTLYGSSSSLNTVSPQTGAFSQVGPLPELIVGLAFSADDSLYGISNNGLTLYRIDPANGRALATMTMSGTTHSSGAPFAGEVNSIAFGPDGTLYGIGFSLYRIDPNTGVATKVSTANRQVSGGLYCALNYGPDGVLRGATFVPTDSFSMLDRIDPGSGIGIPVGNMGMRIGGLASRMVGVAATVAPGRPRAESAATTDVVSDANAAALYDEVLRAQRARLRAFEAESRTLQR
jgi:hypothetical protein